MGRHNNIISNGLLKFFSYKEIYGLAQTIKIMAKHVFHVESMYRLEADLQSNHVVPQSKIPLEIKYFSSEFDIDSWDHRGRIKEIRGDFGVHQFKQRLENGYILVCAFHNHELAGFYWGEVDNIADAGYELGSDYAYGMDCFVFEEYRGNGIHPVLHHSLQRYLKEYYPDKKVLVSHVATWNKKSYRGNLYAGCKITRLEYSLVIMGLHKKFPVKYFA